MTSLLSSPHACFQPAPLNARQQALYLQMLKLPRRIRQVLLLSRLDDLSFDAIATHLRVSPCSVQRDMLHALDRCHALPSESLPGTVAHVARQWYVRLQCPCTTASQRIEFRRWLDAEPEHLQAFHRTEMDWRALLAPAQVLGLSGEYRKPRLGHLRLWALLLALGLLIPDLLQAG